MIAKKELAIVDTTTEQAIGDLLENVPYDKVNEEIEKINSALSHQ